MRIVRIVGMAFGLLTAVATGAHGFDLTGHWVGKTTCKGLGDGEKFARKTEIVADVSESGRDVNIAFQGFGFVTLASGIAVPSTKNADKGELGFVACGNESEPAFGVAGRGKVSTKPSKGSGTVRFTVVVAGKDLNGIGVTDATFTCTGALKRTSTTDAGVTDCPLIMGAAR